MNKDYDDAAHFTSLDKTVEQQMRQEKYRLSPEERRQKLALKKGSVQLHGAIWDFMDARSMAGIVSVAAIVRGYVMDGVRGTIMQEVSKLSSPLALRGVKRGLLREFRRNMAEETADIDALAKGDHSQSPDAIYYNTDLPELMEYYENNPDKFEKAKKSIMESFMRISDAELVEVLGEGDY